MSHTKTLSKNKTQLHMIVEKDVQTLKFGTSSYTVWINEVGEPDIKTLKVTKSRRIKYKT